MIHGWTAFKKCLAAAVLLAVPLLSQESNSNRARIEGKVLDSLSGQPVRKAAVIIRESSQQLEGIVALTDQNGHFEFADLAPAIWMAIVRRDGYVQLGGFEEMGSKALRWKLEPGAIVKDRVLKLTPTGVISGRALDTDGEPLPGATISLAELGAKKSSLPLPIAQTNDLGDFRLHGVPPGKYVVAATYQPSWQGMGAHVLAKPSATGKEAPREDYVTTFYPGVADVAQGSAVIVTAGVQVSGIDIRLHRGGVVRVKGAVSGASGPFVILILSQGQSPQDSKTYYARAQPDGVFEFHDVRPGRYLLQCDVALDTERLRGTRRVEVGSEDVEGIQIAVTAPRKIEGKITVEGSAPLPQGLMALLNPREEGASHQEGGFSPVRPDALFTLDSVYDGRYDFVLAKMQKEPDDFYVKSIRLGDDDILADGLELRGTAPGRIEVVVRDDGGTIACKVVSAKGEPAANVKVLAVPAGARRQALVLHGESETSDTGECTLRGLAPGEYVVLAFDGKERPDVRDDEAWQRVAVLGKKVKVAAKETVDVELKLIPANGGRE